MGTIITDLKEKFRNGDIVIRLIYINVAIFIITFFAGVVCKLMGWGELGSFSFLAFPASLERFILQPWSIITYMFMHGGVWHILFNMLCLYWFGEIFLNSFSTKHLRGLYVLGGIAGAIVFMLSYNIFPYFQPAVSSSVIVGASASILAIIIAIAYRQPDYRVQLFLIGNVSLKYLALFTVVLDLVFMASSNAGGHIAHLGGALCGWIFAASLSKGVDLTLWINKAIDAISSLFCYNTWHRKPKMKVHYYNNVKRETDEQYNQRRKKQDEEIDCILDKLKKSGYGSLSEEEKKRLFDASKK
jgi:membrane associated rhomboid family serine protease